jgi:lipoate-protein ligase A
VTAPALRVVRSGALDPARNMAIDHALLEVAGPPTLRLYGWSPPGLSLGYFQAAAAFRNVPGDHVMVRRVTGGGAIYHADELTFALTLDASLLPMSIAGSYRTIHDAVARSLADIGVPVGWGEDGSAGPRAQAWCFATAGPFDLVTDSGRKIVGSAQRRTKRPSARILHHGSLVCTAPPQTPFCGAVADAVDASAARERIASRLVAHLAAGLGLTPCDGTLSEPELARAAELTRLHESPAHVLRR